MTYRLLSRTASAAFVVCAIGCQHEAKKAATGEREVTLHFDAKLAGEHVACDQPLPMLGENARDATLKDLRFFVHDLALIDAQGKQVAVELPDDGLWQYDNIALIDLEDGSGDCTNGSPEMNTVVLGKVPAGRYTGLFFRIGVPRAQNHAEAALYPAPLSASALHWGWLQGYKYFRLDLRLAGTESEVSSGFEVHLGADSCDRIDGEISCERDNLAEVELPSFDTERDKVVLDLGALLADVMLVQRPDDENVSGCTSKAADPDCAPIFSAFGLDRGSATHEQRIFSAQERESDDPVRTWPDAGGSHEEGDDDAGSDRDAAANGYEIELPPHFPPPVIPELNPLSEAKIELGRHLFYDKRLSGNQTQSCASCHQQKLAFTDGRAVGLGSTGELHVRGAMSLANIAYAATFTWANPLISDLEIQSTIPLFGELPVELGLAGKEEELAERLRADATYQELFGAAFPDERDPFNKLFVARAIASFERTLISGNSAYDRYELGDDSALSESAKRGKALFFDSSQSDRAFECFHCHGGPTFTDQLTHENQPSGDTPFHNTGLYNLDALGSYPKNNQGLFELTDRPADRGRFKAPTLRNIAVTAPYMHDGSLATLEDVVAHYARGGRNVESGPNLGDGKLNRNKSAFIHGFPGASAQDRADLIAFLESLTDDEFLTNPKFGDPWQ